MARVFIAVGSNVEPEKNVPEALRLLDARARITGVSTFYLTEPLVRPGQPLFYNGVVEVETVLKPLELRETVLRPIEKRLKRVRLTDKHAPRTIDLDIIVYGDIVLDAEGLRLPDHEIQERPFLAQPLFELAPEMILPGTDKPIREIAQSFLAHGMKALSGFTERLKKGLGIKG